MGIRMRYFHINNESNIITNICLWDGVSEYNPSGVTLLLAEELPQIQMGDRKTNTGWERFDSETQTWKIIN